MDNEIDEKLWESWREAVRRRLRVKGAKTGDDSVEYTFEDTEAGRDTHLLVRRKNYAILGLDIVAYSQRSDVGRLYLTTLLFGAVDDSVRTLTSFGWIQLPLAVISTGDGAFLVFDDLGAALSTMFCIRMMIDDVNRGSFGGVDPAADSEAYRMLPCDVRFALSTGSLIRIRDLAGQPNFVGEGLVGCARALAISKGAHVLVDATTMDRLLEKGGINEVRVIGAPYDWGQQLLTARLQRRRAKESSLDLYNVFGTFSNRRFLEGLATKAGRDVDHPYERGYEIGSHDTSALFGE